MWERWGGSAEGTWLRSFHKTGTWMLDRIDPEETSLRELPAPATSAEVAYPARADLAEVRRQLGHLAGDRADAVRRRMWWNAAAMPLTLPLMLTPMSNLPIYWFAFRVWSTWKGAKGGVALRGLLDSSKGAVEGGGGGGGGGAGQGDISAWVDISKECTRLSPVGAGAGEGDAAAGDPLTGAEAVCCRVRSGTLETAPAVLFVPCCALDAAAAAVDAEAFDADIVARVETALGADGLTDLARRYHNKI